MRGALREIKWAAAREIVKGPGSDHTASVAVLAAGMHGGASDQQHSNDDYVKRAFPEEDKLLDTKIRSGC